MLNFENGLPHTYSGAIRPTILIISVLLLFISLSTQYHLIPPNIRPFKHSEALIYESLQLYHNQTFNLKEVGLTCSLVPINITVPKVYTINILSEVIGQGEKDFEKAHKFLMQFEQLKHLKWIQLLRYDEESHSINSNKPYQVGNTVATHSQFYNTFLWTINPCRVTCLTNNQRIQYNTTTSQYEFHETKDFFQTILEKIKHTPKGRISTIAYTTLHGHLLAGEERFSVVLRPEDEKVVFEVESYSKGSYWLGTLCLPLIKPLQRKFLEDNIESMKQLMKQ